MRRGHMSINSNYRIGGEGHYAQGGPPCEEIAVFVTHDFTIFFYIFGLQSFKVQVSKAARYSTATVARIWPKFF